MHLRKSTTHPAPDKKKPTGESKSNERAFKYSTIFYIVIITDLIISFIFSIVSINQSFFENSSLNYHSPISMALAVIFITNIIIDIFILNNRRNSPNSINIIFCWIKTLFGFLGVFTFISGFFFLIISIKMKQSDNSEKVVASSKTENDVASTYDLAPHIQTIGSSYPRNFKNPNTNSGITQVKHAISTIDNPEETKNKELIFISSKSEDFDQTQQLYTFLKDRGYNVFFSQLSIPDMGSSDYRKEIDRALDRSKHMIVVTSRKEFVEAPWVEAEWGLFINEKRSGRKLGNIITLIINSMRVEDLPSSLRYYGVIPFDPKSFEKILQYIK